MSPKLKEITDPSKVIRIKCLELPEQHAKGEGEYALRYGHAPKEVFYHDVISLEKELLEIAPDNATRIMDILYNFLGVYINLSTGEICSPTSIDFEHTLSF